MQAAVERRALSEIQEKILEIHIIFLVQFLTPPTGEFVRSLAATFSDAPTEMKSPKLLKGFIDRSPHLVHTYAGKTDSPRCGNAEDLTDLLFDLFESYMEKFHVTSDCIWNINECSVKIRQTIANCKVVTHDQAQDCSTVKNGQLVTVLECISATGKIAEPLFIYQGKHFMESWFPDRDLTESSFFDSKLDFTFINTYMFLDWFKKCTEFINKKPTKWKILLFDGHTNHMSEEFIEYALSKKIIPLYFPSHMTHILQPLDFACFGMMKKKDRHKISGDIVAGWVPSKKRFFESYFHVRKLGFSPKTICKGFQRAGMVPLDRDVAKAAALGSLDKDLDDSDEHSDSSSSESIDSKDPFAEIYSTPIFNPNTSWKSLRMSLINAKVPSFVIEFIKAKFDSEQAAISRLKSSKLKYTRLLKEIAELDTSPSFKRRRISIPNRMATPGIVFGR